MERGSGGSAGGLAAEMAVGLGIAQQMMKDSGTVTPAAAAPAAATPAAGATPEMLSPGDVANMLKVSEADVLAILQSGELAGKKIGSTWRIKRSALDEYLNK
jgi:excisionase family DNA binding protein